MADDCVIHTLAVGLMQSNCYIVHGKSSANALLIDPGDDGEAIDKALKDNKLNPLFIVNTHGHIDHIGANDHFGLPVYIHELDKDFLREPDLNLSSVYGISSRSKAEVRAVEGGDIIELDKMKFEVIHTPGHTPGGICLKYKDVVFTGDTLFCRGIGRTDFPYGSQKLLYESIKKRLFTLPEETVIYPGHGPSSTIGDEKFN